MGKSGMKGINQKRRLKVELIKAVEEDQGFKEVRLRVETVYNEAKAIVVKDDETYERALDFKKIIKMAMKEVDAYFEPSIKAQRAALEELRKAKDKQYVPLKEAEKIVGDVTTKFWIQKQEEARKIKEEQERKRIEEEKARQKEIKEAKKAGIEPPPPKPIEVRAEPEVELPKVKGVSYADNWKFMITNPDEVMRPYLVPDLKAIGKVVDALHEKAAVVVGGIKVFNEPVQRQRT
jgi:hypothetical protein